MGFGTQQQLGNRTGITNQTSLADLFRGGGGISPQPPIFPGGGNISPPGLGQDGQQNQLFTLLQSLLGGQGGFQQPPGQQPPGGPTRQPPIDFGIGQQPPGNGFGQTPGFPGGGNITPIGLGQQLNGFGGTPLTQLSNPFGNLINQRAIR